MSAPYVLCDFDGETFSPSTGFWQRQAVKHYTPGKRYRMVEEAERSQESHRHYFASLSDMFESLPEKYADEPWAQSSEHLRHYALAHGIHERHGATPYGFRFVTRTRSDDDLDSKVTARSNLYYLGGRIETLAEVEARNDPREAILRSNMRGNRIDRIIVNDNSWRFTGPLEDGDVVLDFSNPDRKSERAEAQP